MESNSLDETHRSSREISLGASQTSLKSTHSLDKSSSGGSLKREKGNIQFKESPQEIDNQRNLPDASIKVPHKIIANWKSACDKTKDKTKDLLKRWRTLPEIETENVNANLDNSDNKKENPQESGWSVHVWSFEVNNVTYLTKEGWLNKWEELLIGSRNLIDFPIWLQFFVKVLFQVINRGGTGIITSDELNNFYSSVLCLDTSKVGEILNTAYQAMTSSGDHPLHYRSYRLSFSNYLLGRYPNGPGHHILGAPIHEKSSAMFPVDYSALNAQPEDLEQYTPDQKSNRRSVIV
ncbi:unnamed protein product [Ceutorhynchus assimilis]|uniref:Uncharacterized protein n=1 Tax=Ceutorhynchus assimilis TaxID=467358 RepID=A0A9P0DFK8_9CUCU|nr:unnamed protein product [Ceutorhynchus assimilis]